MRRLDARVSLALPRRIPLSHSVDALRRRHVDIQAVVVVVVRFSSSPAVSSSPRNLVDRL